MTLWGYNSDSMADEAWEKWITPMAHHETSLKSFTTRQLLNALDTCRMYIRWYTNDKMYYPETPKWLQDKIDKHEFEMPEYFLEDEIKAELATREHVPNKQEARAIRQRQAKEKMR